MLKRLTGSEDVIPPVGLTDEGFEVVSGSSHNDVRRSDHGADEQEDGEDGHDDAQTLHQVQIGDFHRLGRTHPEYHRYPESTTRNSDQ